jgi:hypothetical protein
MSWLHLKRHETRDDVRSLKYNDAGVELIQV